MQGQCPNCKGLFEIKQEWIGMKAPCPHCHQTITLLAMPPAGAPATPSSIDLTKGNSSDINKGDSALADTSANNAEQYQTPPAAPAQYSTPPAAPAQYSTPPAAPAQYSVPPSAPVSYQQPQQYAGSVQTASVIERFIAMIIDSVIIGIGTTIISFVIGLIGGLIVGALSAATNSEGIAVVGSILINLLTALISAAICFSYEGYFLSTSGATIGKKVMGIKVLHAGEYPSFLRGGCRYLAKGISFFICMIGYIMACFTQDNKALHDMICDTVVVKG